MASMINEPKLPVTVIGLGLMGQALAGAFLQAGHPTTVWNRTTSKANGLVTQGAELAASVSEALEAAPVVIMCVTDYDVAHELLDKCGAQLNGRLLVNLTSGDSAQAREAALWAEQLGARYLDGAIMALPLSIGTADATILYSGPQSELDAHRTALDALGTVAYLGEDHGLSALYDVAGLSMMWSVLNGWLHGTALLRSAGVDAATYTPFAHQMAVGTSDWLSGYASQIDNDSFPADDSTLDTHAGGMAHLIEQSEVLGINAELPRLFQALADRAIAAGHGGESYPVLIEEFSKKLGAR